jgi:hypothetical protein
VRLLPSQRVDQLIHLVDQILHLTLVVAAIGPLAERADAVAVVARLLERVGDGVVEVVDRRPLLDVGIEGGELAARSVSLPKVVENEDLLPMGRGAHVGTNG